MIQGIRRKFILIAVAVLSAAMITLAVVINVSNWIQVRGEIKETLTDLAENTGNNGKVEKGGGRKGRNRHMQNTLDESRFFTVHIFSNDAFFIADASRSSGETEEEMTKMVREALNSGNQTGATGHYMYLITEGGERNTGIFLNVETKRFGNKINTKAEVA